MITSPPTTPCLGNAWTALFDLTNARRQLQDATLADEPGWTWSPPLLARADLS